MATSDIRTDYAGTPLTEESAGGDPFALFDRWFKEAVAAQPRDPNAMTLATVSADGTPAARMVLLKAVDTNGFVFFTNYASAKGQHLAANPRAALLFFWPALERQVRISGAVTRVSREESEKYFHSRPFESQVSAAVSPQSTIVEHREALEQRFDAAKREHHGRVVPMPETWGGYRLAPREIEFWQGRPSRLHDRLLFTREPDGTWKRVRLAP